MPSILIECGFLTNPKEEDFLHSEEGQDYLASAIFRAFRTYQESIDGIKTTNDLQQQEITTIKQEEKNNISKKEIVINNDEVVYKIQIGTYFQSMLMNKLFQEMKAEEQIVNRTYKYFVGRNHSKAQMDITKIQMQEKGFKGAFIVAFYKGRKITVKEALDLQNKTNDHE